MPDWNRPRRRRTMRRVQRQHGYKPKGCPFWLLCVLAVITAVLVVAGSYGMRH